MRIIPTGGRPVGVDAAFLLRKKNTRLLFQIRDPGVGLLRDVAFAELITRHIHFACQQIHFGCGNGWLENGATITALCAVDDAGHTFRNFYYERVHAPCRHRQQVFLEPKVFRAFFRGGLCQ